MLDYETPCYPLKQAAGAAGFEHNSLRSFYQRGHFRVMHGVGATSRGAANMLTLRDVLHVGAARHLIDIGVHPADAFAAAVAFAQVGSDDDRGKRMPGRIYSEREHAATFLIYYEASRSGRVLASGDGLSLTELTIDPSTGLRSATGVVLLNDVVRDVTNALVQDGARQLEELA